MSSTPWWHPETHAKRRNNLILRNRIKTRLRDWFFAEGFIEFEAAALQISPGNETHLHAFATGATRTGTGDQLKLYLHTSPEFAAKKLLAAGETKIFDFARVFRDRESGPLNVPEFTMLEWYRADVGYEAAMDEALTLLKIAAETIGTERLRHGDRTTNPFSDAGRLRVQEAFGRFAGIDLAATLDETGEPRLVAMAAAATESGVRVAPDDSWSDIFSRVMAERIEPHLVDDRPMLLLDYPAPEAALARRTPDDRRFAERFELYACGVELANGFGELTDPTEQRRRFELAMDDKERIYGERYPLDEDFLDALTQMPPASGVALGFDRLVMLCVGAPSVDDVIWTPSDWR